MAYSSMKLADCKDLLGQKDEQLQQLKDQLESQETQLKDRNTRIDDLEQESEAKEGRITSKDRQLEENAERDAENKTEMDTKDTEISFLTADNDRLKHAENQKIEAQTAADGLSAENITLKEENESLHTRLKEVEAKLTELTEKAERELKEMSDTADTLRECLLRRRTKKIGDKGAEITDLLEKVDSLEQRRPEVVRQVTRAETRWEKKGRML